MVASTLPELLTMAAPGASHTMLTLTKLDMTTAERAFEQGKQAYGLQNYSQAVDFYTHALELLRSELESVILLHRASAYEMLSKYDRAAEDAKQANPNNDLVRPDPYLVRANILLLQRRWHEATNIYKRGAIIVSNTYRQRALLVDKYQRLTTFTQKYNQWIAEMLPYEVVSQILSYMSTTDRVQLASTCNFWRDFIHQQQQGTSSLWHTIHISEMASSSNPENIGPLLYSVAPDKPKTITLNRSDKDDMTILHKVSQKILGIANDRRWDKLETLEAGDCGPGAPLEIILKRNQNTLTSLTLHTWVNSLVLDQRDPLESAILAAKTCKNLHSLSQHFDGRYIGDQLPTIPSVLSSESLLSPTPSKDLCLTKLVLRNGMDEDSGLVPLLQQSPYLTSFTLNSPKYRNCTRILTLLCEHCPNIQEFIYMGTSDSRLCTTYYTIQQRQQQQQEEKEHHSAMSLSMQPSLTSIAATSYKTTTTVGIKKLILKFWSMDLGTTMDDEPISSAFRKCHTTLETLELDMGTPLASRYKCLDILSLLGASCLQTLVLNLHDHEVGSETIANLIFTSPALQTVNIQGSGFWHPQLFHALASLTNLQKLSIYQTHYDDDDRDDEEKEGIIQNGHWFAPVLNNEHSRLVDFTYRHNNSNEDTAFLLDLAPYIAQSTTLQKLNLQEIPIQSRDVLLVILGHLVQSRTLDTLHVWLPFNEISESDMMAFTAIEKLTNLDIWDTSGAITEEMMHNVFRKLQNRNRFIFIRVDDPDTEHTVKGYTHGKSTITSSHKIDQKDEGQTNYVIEEYLGSNE